MSTPEHRQSVVPLTDKAVSEEAGGLDSAGDLVYRELAAIASIAGAMSMTELPDGEPVRVTKRRMIEAFSAIYRLALAGMNKPSKGQAPLAERQRSAKPPGPGKVADKPGPANDHGQCDCWPGAEHEPWCASIVWTPVDTPDEFA